MKTEYIHRMLLAKVNPDESIQYYIGDHLGSTRQVLDASRNLVFSAEYEPFGKAFGVTGSEAYRYTGERHDDPAGLVYLRARQYDPDLGRFVSADPVLGSLAVPQTLNRYPYVNNNPLRFTDPAGEFLNIVFGAIAGAVIGGISCAATQGWSWSNECWIAVGFGAVAGAVAGATFNPALGLFVAEGATASFAATVAAGAISGAVAGAAGYAAEGAIVTASGGSFEWSAQELGKSALLGAVGGALGAGVGAKLFGLPTREPLRTLWSLPASLQSLLGASGSVTRAAVATAIGGVLVRNLAEGAIDELIEEGLRRLLPFETGVSPSFVAASPTSTGSVEGGAPISSFEKPTPWIRAIQWYTDGTA